MTRSEMMESFFQDAQEALGGLEEGASLLKNEADTSHDLDQMNRMMVLAHRLRGTAGLYGFPQLSNLAGVSERLLESRPQLPPAGRQQFVTLMGDITAWLRQGLDYLDLNGKEMPLGLEFSRSGGTKALQDLVYSYPQAFKPQSAAKQFHDQQLQAATEEAATQETVAAPQASLEQELRDFYKGNAETWEYYAPEVQEHLDNLREQLSQGTQGDVDVMFRSAHTIKGSSYMVGFSQLGDFAHKVEDLLGAVRDGAQPLEGSVQQLLEDAADTIEQYLKVAAGDPQPLSAHAEKMQRQLQALAQGETLTEVEEVAGPEVQATEAPAVAVATTVRVRSEQLEALMDLVGDLVVARSRMVQTLDRLYGLEQAMADSQARFQRTVRDFEERYLNPDMVRLGQEAEAPSSAAQAAPGGLGADISQQFDELEFDTYNDLNILARSMTELSADFAEMRTRFGEGLNELSDDSEDLGKLVRRLRMDVSRTSRVPFSQSLIRLRRWAREHSEQFELHVEGENLEIENSVLQNLNEPLLHLLTNAVVHGIGDAEQRRAAGKDPMGHVTISAREVGSFLEVSVEDDGRGLDLDAIRIRALERGQRSAQELAQMSDDDLARLILLPGLSTAREVTSAAGRGVGMDVVASSMRRLGGDLLIRTQRGQGTRITLRVPTSQQIIDVLQVRMGQQMLGFATNVIQALRELREIDLAVGENGFEVLDEGQWLPILDLRQVWGLPATDDTWKLVVLRSVNGNVAVRVDDFDRIEEVAVTPLTGVLSALDYISATSVATTGEVLPILDPSGLQRLYSQPERWIREGAADQVAHHNRRILLVDDSLSVRRVVSRMLERGGYEVQTANDGQEAFDLLQFGLEFDLVVTDLEMPRMNGYELLEAVRGRQATHNLPMVVMTTRAGDKHQRLAFQLGANDYFSKPVDEALLLRRLSKILEEQQAS